MGEAKITLDILEQDKIWTTRDGRTLRLEDMDSMHRKNTVRMLEHMAVKFNMIAFTRYFCGSTPSSNTALDMFEREMNEFIRQDPLEWLREQPPVRRLRTLIEDDNARERRLALRLASSHATDTGEPVRRSRRLSSRVVED